MRIEPIITPKITEAQPIEDLLSSCLRKLSENSIVAITSKVVSICEGRMIDIEEIDKEKLVKQEADLYLPKENQFGTILTIKNNILIPTAGIDESNGNGKYILWPADSQLSANKIRNFLRKKFRANYLGVIITDSKTTPLRLGTTGISIAHSGFSALNCYIGKKDIFGRKLKMTNANIADGLAAAAVLAMGEGAEQTPIAIITDISMVKFKKNSPSTKELETLAINRKDDIYGELLNSVKWKQN